MTPLRAVYQRRMLTAIAMAAVVLGLFLGFSRILSPVDNLHKQLALAAVTLSCAVAGYLLIRRFRFLPCPNCQGELRAAATAAWSHKQTRAQCPHCQATVQL